MSSLYAIILPTGLGWIGVVMSQLGLRTITRPRARRDEVGLDLRARFGGELVLEESWQGTARQSLEEKLRAYFDGQWVAFDEEPVDFAGMTEFQQRTLGTVRRIPYGELRTYQWLAGEIGQPKGARAVGQAVGANPVPIIIPCHRVVAAGGRLGGYGWGLDAKRWLLGLEGCRVP